MNPEDELLGCILAGADPADLPVQPEDFWEPRNETIYRACLTVADTGRRCDPQTVGVAMGVEAHKLPNGGMLHLVNLASDAIPANAPAIAQQVRAAADRRAIIEIAQRIIQQAQDDERNPADLLDDARAWLDRPTGARADAVELADLVPAFIDRVESGEEPGLTTPWPDVDRFLNGLHPSRLYTVGGRPGAGKSVMLTNLAAYFAAKHRQRVYFATLEMSRQELLGRIYAATANVSQTNLLTGRMSENDWNQVARYRPTVEGMAITVCDESHQTLRSIRTGARDLKRRGGLGLVVVDYLQLITPPDKRISRQQQIGEITRGLKALARDLECPVLTASQLRRPQNPKERPTMSDLRESGDIEADSDVIVLLHAENENEPWDLTAHVEKNRAGGRGPVKLYFDTTRALMNSAEWKATA